jgi:hypothetical protein
MTATRKTERYRGFELVADTEQGKGAAWKKGGPKIAANGSDLDLLLGNLRSQIDEAFPRTLVDIGDHAIEHPALAAAYVDAFRRVISEDGVPDSYVAMLQGLIAAPLRQMNDYELQAVTDYKNVNTVNLHFGKFGGKIRDALQDLGFEITLPPNSDGSPCVTYTVAINVHQGVKGELCTWRLRPESVLALQAVGIS